MGLSSCRKSSSGLPLILHYGQLYNNFFLYHNVIVIEIKCMINEITMNHPENIPPPRFVEKFYSEKPALGANKLWDHLFRGFFLHSFICFFFFSWKLVVRSILEFRIFYWNISYADMYFLWFHYKRLIISFCLTLRDAEMQWILVLSSSCILYIPPLLSFTYSFSIHWWHLPRIILWGYFKIEVLVSTIPSNLILEILQ